MNLMSNILLLEMLYKLEQRACTAKNLIMIPCIARLCTYLSLDGFV
jgi:hypothetical protein